MRIYIFFIIFFILVLVLAGLSHEYDLSRNFKRDGDAHSFIFEIKR